jgi:hypothetical protein
MVYFENLEISDLKFFFLVFEIAAIYTVVVLNILASEIQKWEI